MCECMCVCVAASLYSLISLLCFTADFEPVGISLTFAAGSSLGTQECVDVAITDDDVFEDDETFSVTLTTDDGSVDTVPDRTDITIVDDEGDC